MGWFTERHNEKRGNLGAEIQLTFEINSRDVERPKERNITNLSQLEISAGKLRNRKKFCVFTLKFRSMSVITIK